MLRLFLGRKVAGTRVPDFYRVLPSRAGDKARVGCPEDTRFRVFRRSARPAEGVSSRCAASAPTGWLGFHSTRLSRPENAAPHPGFILAGFGAACLRTRGPALYP